MLGECVEITIPAYQRYQAGAKLNVIKGTVNQVVKAFGACITDKAASVCASNNIDNLLEAQPNVAIANVASTSTEECFTIIGSGSLANYSACVALTGTNGTVTRASSDADIGNATAPACDAAGACTN